MIEVAMLLDIAKQLIEKPSITPNDCGCQAFIAEFLAELGFEITELPFGDVKNLWAVYGTAKPLFVFAGHTDVVPPGPLDKWTSDPFKATVHGDYLLGRGSADMKGNIAAMLVAVKDFLAKGPKINGQIGFLITGDEEGVAVNFNFSELTSAQISICNVLGQIVMSKKVNAEAETITMPLTKGNQIYFVTVTTSTGTTTYKVLH